MDHTVTPTNGQSAKSNASLPTLKLRIGDGAWSRFDAKALDPPDWQDLREQCEQSDKKVYFKVQHLPRWPDDARYSLLILVQCLGTRCRLWVHGVRHDDAFEAVLSSMTHALPLHEQQQMQRAAIEAAALFYADAPEAAAQQINQRLGEIGAAKVNHLRLIKQIRDVAGGAPNSGTKAVDAQSAAVQFLEHLRKEADAADDDPVLWYHQGDCYLWRSPIWERVEDRRFEAQVMRFLQSLDVPRLTQRFCRDVVAHLQGMTLLDCWQESMPFEVVSEADPLQIRHRRLIVFGNGAIDLDEALENDEPPELVHIGPEYFNEIALPYEFDPEAECPLWLETLEGILPTPKKTKKPSKKKASKKTKTTSTTAAATDRRQDVLQEFMGYALLGDCRLQKFLVLLGDGGNGKSTITETWEAMLGDENVSSVRLDELGDKFRAWSLKGKLANFSGELSYLGNINEALVKRIVSGEAVEVDRKHKEAIKLRTHAKLVVNTNDMPQVRDPTPATWDRMIVMPFEQRIRGTNKEDENRAAKLQEELPGIFLWTLVGLKRLLKQGGFTRCGKCEAATRRHRVESDSVLQFVAECCEHRKGYRTKSRGLYEVYQLWAQATGRKAVQEGEFGKRLKRAGWKKGREAVLDRPRFYADMTISGDGLDYHRRWKNQRHSEHGISYQADQLP